MSKPITKIQMTGFRGAIGAFELDFDPKKDFTMLFGENGSGKSSILDAMDVVCRGTNGCLDGVSVGQNPGKYLCALGTPPATLKVIIHSDGESWTGTMRRSAINVAGPAVKPKVKILRRNAILELVLAQPSERYKALRHFIDIACVEQSEGTLQQKLDDTNRAITTLIGDKDRMATQLEGLWTDEGRPGPGQTAMAWAEQRVNTGIQGLNDKLARLKEVVEAVAAATAAKTEYETRNEKHSNVAGQLAEVNQQIANAPSLSSTTAVQLLESLEKAKAYIEAEDSLDKCPTCQRPMGRDELLDIVNHASEQLSELKTLTDNRQRIQGWVNTAASHLEEATTKLVEALKKVQEVVQAGDVPELVALNVAWPTWEQATDNMEALVAVCSQLEPVQTTLEQQRDTAQRDVNQFNSIKQWWNGIKEANEKMADLDRIRKGLKKAFDIVHEKRVAFTQSILDGIRQEADRLFQAIHPDENIGLEQLKMEEERRGSVSQTGVFHGHTDIPPQAVFSESHLDTLGFCVWLALAKREAPDQMILLIDDIFSSVDATHLGRVIDLLSAEAPNFLQVVVATHYRLWWDRCQNAQGIQRVHLGRWCATNGIAAQNMPRVLDELRAKIGEAVLDRQAVSSKAGILLESILDDLTLLYECSLPHNKLNLYTLGALLNGCSKLFSKHNLTVTVNDNWNADGQPENWQATASKAAYDRVNGLQFIRNQVGCHFNTPGMEIPDGDVRDFGTATIALVEALTCPNCGALATKTANDGTHLRCSCPKKAARMTPVVIQ
ncbi:MAG: AAA family ATPase [Planctomycetes bacterium]|nr:AAA family ATPase [Planctomycetota bacterium]